MAAILPTDLFPGYKLYASGAQTLAAEGIFIPLTALPYLTSAEANETTGDGREVARQIDLAIDTKIAALATEDKPTYMTSGVGVTSLANGNRRITVSRTYELTAPVAQLALVAEPEPEP